MLLWPREDPVDQLLWLSVLPLSPELLLAFPLLPLLYQDHHLMGLHYLVIPPLFRNRHQGRCRLLLEVVVLGEILGGPQLRPPVQHFSVLRVTPETILVPLQAAKALPPPLSPT